MHRVSSVSLPVALVLSLAGAGCSRPDVVVEVLPPRTSVTCAAPTRADAALGRGVFDVQSSVAGHGAYIADLRLSVKGQDAHIDGVTVGYAVPDGSGDGAVAAAEAASGDVVVGDVLLSGDGDDARVAVIENVQLVPRSVAVAFDDDDELGLSKVDFATLGVTITPVFGGLDDGETASANAAASTFALDLCDGCLVLPPSGCNGDTVQNPSVCRPGQDTPSFTCVAAPTSNTGAP